MPTKAAASFLGVVPATLEKWLWLGRGPAYSKPGGKRVIYRRSELERFLQECSVTPEGEPQAYGKAAVLRRSGTTVGCTSNVADGTGEPQ